MTNKKNDDVKKPKSPYKDPFVASDKSTKEKLDYYWKKHKEQGKKEEAVDDNPFITKSENNTEQIDDDPFVFGKKSDHSKVNERDSSLEKHKEHEDKDDQPSHAMTLDEQIDMYENYDYNIGDSGQYLGGRN